MSAPAFADSILTSCAFLVAAGLDFVIISISWFGQEHIAPATRQSPEVRAEIGERVGDVHTTAPFEREVQWKVEENVVAIRRSTQLVQKPTGRAESRHSLRRS
ncbi:hypothetical protein MGEO_20225 [Marivita geojedonensis]|uniref:Uncharacterized protein n=2 Tax=Marivita geojedonensis TaxID=1123756 RepID=A0A1X4N981_9RHOB|nr:hypothetical protein MGEO_20225 [Marivita geojedonensis]